jgi:ferritin-like metal-binding protein YciE
MARNSSGKKTSTSGSRTSSSTKDSSITRTADESGKTPQSLRELFEDGLKDIYNAEKQLLDALPEVAKAADNEELSDAARNHLEETKKQVERIEKVFNRLHMEVEEGSCQAMEGLIQETNDIIEEYEAGPTRDAALIIGMQKIEHYEMAVYGSLCELADVMGYPKIADILDRTLEEEENADKMLTDIARDVNEEALEMSESEMQY